ncbi:HGGxSTG domain-containing protein [uncultured Phenylobacterium sp.]|uniref:HGGxSTG domain-containing protein n=1 Tax=uncultured Phenylobacterium sp. TaxID=349273 RepID=UPI00345C8481
MHEADETTSSPEPVRAHEGGGRNGEPPQSHGCSPLPGLARYRRATPCKAPAMRGKTRCALHGGKNRGLRRVGQTGATSTASAPSN